jgi:hypothetical protein
METQKDEIAVDSPAPVSESPHLVQVGGRRSLVVFHGQKVARTFLLVNSTWVPCGPEGSKIREARPSCDNEVREGDYPA